MKRNVMKGFLVMLVVFLVSTGQGNLHARLVFNQVDAFFDDTTEKQTVRSFTIEAAGYFLKAYSDILVLSDRIEMSDLNGIDYHQTRLLADTAMFNLENAREKYLVLNQIATNSSYDMVLIHNLRGFDFRGFGDRQLLGGKQFELVTHFLKKGDIQGIFERAISDIEIILEKLKQVRLALNSLVLPDMLDIWELNRFCSEFMLFGQFSARIFYQITGI
jgi:hypothetical protein